MLGAKKTTLVRVAELAGVSIASVSRVLNGLGASAETTERVRKAARELGYVPDATARSLKAGKTEQISLAVADVGNPVYVAMMNEVSRVVTHAGYRLVLSSTGNDPREQIELLDGLNRGFADGLIMSPLRITDELVQRLQASWLPTVIIGSLPEEVELDSVRADSVKGVSLAVNHLADAGRENIAFINGPADTIPGRTRLGGYLAAMAERGLSIVPENQVEATDFTYHAGLEAAGLLLERGTPDALVCANDLLAVAAMKVITERGLSVPDDIALVGMDDTDIAEISNPALTSVDLGATLRARAAAELLLRRLDDPSAAVEQVVIEPSLTVRESSIHRGSTLSDGEAQL